MVYVLEKRPNCRQQDWVDENDSSIRAVLKEKQSTHNSLFSHLKCVSAQAKLQQMQDHWWDRQSDKVQFCAEQNSTEYFCDSLKEVFSHKHTSPVLLKSAEDANLVIVKAKIMLRLYKHFPAILEKDSTKVRSRVISTAGSDELRYQHGLSTPDLRQTLPNLKNFMEHGLMVRCDHHHISSAIPVPQRQLNTTFGRSESAFQYEVTIPDHGLRKRASSENEKLQYKTPPPSYHTALTHPITIVAPPRDLSRKQVSSSLDDTSIEYTKADKKEQGVPGDLNGETCIKSFVTNEGSTVQQQPLPLHSSTMNGTVLPPKYSSSLSDGQSLDFSSDLCCSVEQAEEIMGTEATGFDSGEHLEAFNCIPVDHAVAVECDEQVLGELDVEGFEEFSRRIYALNENMSSFRRARKSSDK
nr:PREDICTED: UV radiation resistance-associated gene protein-like [Latimeria chalumnae]|eukprot:XP_014350118.1 PREDICTED: UV radiation resistance-associated gene protein-like [Latimeria chalumnae]